MHNNYVSKSSPFVLNLSNALKNGLSTHKTTIPDLIDLASVGVPIPDGFIITTAAYFDFLKSHHLSQRITDLLSTIHYERPDSLMQVANHIQKMIINTEFSADLIKEINTEYKKLGGLLKNAQVNIGEENNSTKNIIVIIQAVKFVWASRFEAKNLLAAHNQKRNIFSGKNIIYVLKKLNSNCYGKIYTDNLKIDPKTDLKPNHYKSLMEIGKKIKHHFYIPQEIDWVIEKNKIYVVRLKSMTNTQKTYLALVRHGESEWNAKGLWTGWTDVPLSEKGHTDAKKAGIQLKDIHFNLAYTSALLRAIQTLEEIKKAKGQSKIPTVSHKALNERDYGDLTGKNKWEIKKEFGEEQFMKWRRSWDSPLPNGEALKDVYERVLPYYKEIILPKLKSGKNIIIAAHGNSLRALVKYLDNISDDDISKLEIPVGQVILYQIDEDGKVVNKEIRNQHENKV